MPRVKLEMPEMNKFESHYKVGIGDINYGNHLGNDRILSIAHGARLEYIQSLGFKDELSFGENIGIIQTDAEVVYKAEAFFGDELKIRIGIDGVHRYGFEMYYEITKDDNLVVSHCKTGILFFDYSSRKPLEFPEHVMEKLEVRG